MKHFVVVSASTALVFGASPSLGQCQWRWERINATGPFERFHHGFVYDSTRSRVVLYGGVRYLQNGSLSVLGDQWAWDGSAWNQVTPSHTPGPRYRSLIAYDRARDRIVLHGGAYGTLSGDYNYETWEFDGNDWSLMTGISPPTVALDTSMVYDTTRKMSVTCFGYPNWSSLTWGWDGQSWQQLGTIGPAWRYYSGMVWHAARSDAILYGGLISGGTPTDELRFFDGDTWSLVDSIGPGARYNLGLAYDAKNNLVVLMGGLQGTSSPPRGDTWVWDGHAWTEVVPEERGPGIRSRHRLVYDETRQEILLFGGRGDGDVSLDDFWRLTRAPKSDFDGDGFVTGLDYDLYVQAFEAGEASSDFDGDGFITGLDFDLYVQAFEAGC